MPPSFLIEPMDRISFDGTDWRVKTVGTSLDMSREGPRISQAVECRRYYTFTEPTL
jgi:hypothetical protein